MDQFRWVKSDFREEWSLFEVYFKTVLNIDLKENLELLKRAYLLL